MKPLKNHNVLAGQAANDAELESLLHKLGVEIERQRNMIRALSYGTVATAFFFFAFGAVVGSIF